MPAPGQQAYCGRYSHHGLRPGGNMKNDDKDPDDTFSDLLKVIALVVIALFVIGGWYFS
ncbi:hypothetical protein B194_2228 [Serratia plymuthica A30]|nr:hypothetical protein B194_2228 [Serratia plymuthica A30]